MSIVGIPSVAQQLKLCLPMQGCRFYFWSGNQDPTYQGMQPKCKIKNKQKSTSIVFRYPHCLEIKNFTIKSLNQNKWVEVKAGEISARCKHQVINN